ncbi:two-component regulator propeller domain-containing protein [Ekhidna sp.]|uniref:ligand-binding sensor domain-containing protein n=1 Tax=Ekhidna sp. TaxID=2608089 RepID=UPI003514D28D
MITRIKASFIGIFSCLALSASLHQYDIRHFNPETGLNGTYVYTTIQGPQGYKWVGTDYGLTRFNGLDFELMDGNDSTKKNFTTAAYSDQGEIYFGYFNGQIKRFNGVGFQVLYKPENEQNSIVGIVRSNDQLVALTQNNGLLLISKDSVRYAQFAELKNQKANFIYEFQDFLLIGTNEGLLVFEYRQGTIQFTGRISGLEYMSVQTLEKSKEVDNAFWVGTDYGVYHLELNGDGRGGETYKTDYLETASITSIKETANFDLWIGTKYSGLVKIDFNRNNSKSRQFTYFNRKGGFPGDQISTLYRDADESLWIGTIGDGLIQVRKKGLLFYNFESFRARSVNSISGNSRHEFFFGTDVGLIKGFYTGQLDSVNFELIEHRATLGNNISAVFVDKKDQIYFAADDKGLYVSDATLRNFKKINFDHGKGSFKVRQILKDSEDNLWLSLHQKGVYVLDSQHNVINHFSTRTGFYHNEIYHIHFDKKGNTWFAAHGAGLAIMKPDSSIVYMTKEGLFPAHDVNDISEDEYGNIWIGTHGNGIYEYTGDEFVRVSTEEGLLNNYCNSIISDKNNHVWATHRTGLSRVDEFTEAVSTIQKKDGLMVTEFIHNSIYRDVDHNIWIGNRNGVTFLSTPDEIFESQIIKPIISDVKVNYAPMDLYRFSKQTEATGKVPEGLVFPYNYNNLTFEFISINLRNPTSNLYQFWLEGQESEWSPITNDNHITFTNLKPGDYTFYVRQSDNPNHWGDNIASLSFQVKPPWWNTWWAILLFILVGSLMIYSLIKWQTSRLRNRMNEKMRLISITESQNKRLKEFSFITSHNTRSSVSNIMGLISALESDPSNNEFIKMLRTSSDRLNLTIRHINDLLNFENDRESLDRVPCNVKNTIENILSANDELIQEKQAQVVVNVSDDLNVFGAPTYLQSALNNLISNALHYGITDESKVVRISAEKQVDEVEIQIEDHGIGIDLQRFGDKLFSLGARFHQKKSQGDGLGMFISRNQIEGMEGEISISSLPGKGTTVHIHLKSAG